MNALRLLHLLLVVHFAGFTLMAGTTAVNFVAFKRLSNAMTEQIDAVHFYFKHKKIFDSSGLLILGAILLISSGVGLLLLTRVYDQLWFEVKMGIVVALISNGFLFGSRQEQRIKQFLDAPDRQSHLRLRTPVTNLRIFYAIQLFLFLTIILLSVAKPG
jgi:curli biogenesis system outer membrane secretion channel CsgG